MPAPGAKPKDGPKVTRVQPTHDWTEVPDAPYAGPRPALPKVVRKGWGWTAATRRWWEVVTTMPHCALWKDGDWQFALDTARIHANFIAGHAPSAQELRVREKIMGTTADARRDLRIRYVPVEPAAVSENPGVVSDFEAERRRRILEED